MKYWLYKNKKALGIAGGLCGLIAVIIVCVVLLSNKSDDIDDGGDGHLGNAEPTIGVEDISSEDVMVLRQSDIELRLVLNYGNNSLELYEDGVITGKKSALPFVKGKELYRWVVGEHDYSVKSVEELEVIAEWDAGGAYTVESYDEGLAVIDYYIKLGYTEVRTIESYDCLEAFIRKENDTLRFVITADRVVMAQFNGEYPDIYSYFKIK